MFRRFFIGSFRLFLAGEGVSAETGRDFALAAVLGVIVGLVTAAFAWMIEWGNALLMEGIGHHVSLLPDGVIHRSPFDTSTFTEPRRWVLLVLPALGALAGTVLLRRLGHAAAARGTDSAVRAFHHSGGHVTSTVLPVKSVASVLTVASGGSGGYEGPMTLLGAACGSTMARVLRLDARMKRVLMAAGLAAGIGALFRAPLAGAIFGAEIFYSSSDMEYEVILPGFVASAVAYTVYACFYGWAPLFAMPDYVYTNGWRLLPYLALGVVCALGARVYISFFRGTEALFGRLAKSPYAAVALGGLATGVIGFFLPDVLGAGYGIIQKAFLTHDEVAGAPGLRDLPLHGFLLFFFVKTVATACTVGSGGSAGVFAPALVCGGCLGAAAGIFFQQTLPASMGVQPGAFALVGMAGFAAAAIRVPLAAIVMVAEMSGNHGLLVPTMWVCGIAFWLDNGWALYRSQVHSRESSPVHNAYLRARALPA